MKHQTVAVFVCLAILMASAPNALPRQSQPAPANAAGSRTVIEREEQVPVTPQPPVSSALRQSTANRGNQVEQAKRRVEKLGIARRVTVVLINGNEYYGAISQIGEDSFQLDEIDLKRQIKIAYVEVKTVRKGFGDFNQFTGKRWRTGWHKGALIAIIAAVVVLPLVIRLLARE